MDPPDPADPPDQVSSAAVRNHSSTRTGGEDYVSSNQTPSNHEYVIRRGWEHFQEQIIIEYINTPSAGPLSGL